jgi:hypothetical protein
MTMNLISKENLESLKKALSTAEGQGVKEALALCEAILAQEPKKPSAWVLTRNHGGGHYTKTLHLEKPAEPRFPALAWVEELYLPTGPLPTLQVAASKAQTLSVADKVSLEKASLERANINLAKKYGARIATRNLMSNPVQVVHEVDFPSYEKFRYFCDDMVGMKGKQISEELLERLCKDSVIAATSYGEEDFKRGIYFKQDRFHRFCVNLIEHAQPQVAKSVQVTWPKL